MILTSQKKSVNILISFVEVIFTDLLTEREVILKKDLIAFWGTKDYFVKLGKIDKGQNEGKWYLLLKWKN